MKVAALFIDEGPHGIYNNMPDVEPWGPSRDARLYTGPHPVVAHPPCHLWVNLAAVNWKRYGKQKPAWYEGGDDGGCFASALKSVRKYGGVLEHPAYTHAFNHHHIDDPTCIDKEYRGWYECYWAGGESGPGGDTYFTCEVYQSAYGHKARKKTWLLYCGARPPFELRWDRNPGTHQVGWFDRSKPTLGKREASATPPEFAEELVKLARWSRQP